MSNPARLPFGPLSSRRLLALASDGALVDQMRRGNEAAYTVAFERHASGLLSFCRHMVGSSEEAEDAVQHTFAAAFRHLERFAERQLTLKPWLYAIARNRCLSMLRSRREHCPFDFDLPTEGLTEQVERRAELRNLLRDLHELPEAQRAALLLSEAGDLSHAEVADVLDCEVAHVKALVFRARRGLIERRDARETGCEDIRELLANLRGNSLRRSELRHHLRSCAGCRDFRDGVKRQRGLLKAALPVIPTLQLKASVLGASGLGGGSLGGGLGAGFGTGLSASLGAGTVVKVAAVGLLVGGVATSGEALLAHAEGLLASSPETAARAPVSPTAKQSPRRVIAGSPMEPGAPQGRADTPAQEQRPGAPPVPGAQPDGERRSDPEQDGSSDPSAEGAPGHDASRGHGEDSGTIGPGREGRSETAAPPAGGAPDGGLPTDKGGPPADKGGPPSIKGSPPEGRGSPPAHKGGAPAAIPGQAGPPSATPGKVGQPPESPGTQSAPLRPEPTQGTPEPKAESGHRPTTPAPLPVPSAAPRPAPV